MIGTDQGHMVELHALDIGQLRPGVGDVLAPGLEAQDLEVVAGAEPIVHPADLETLLVHAAIEVEDLGTGEAPPPASIRWAAANRTLRARTRPTRRNESAVTIASSTPLATTLSPRTLWTARTAVQVQSFSWGCQMIHRSRKAVGRSEGTAKTYLAETAGEDASLRATPPSECRFKPARRRCPGDPAAPPLTRSVGHR